MIKISAPIVMKLIYISKHNNKSKSNYFNYIKKGTTELRNHYKEHNVSVDYYLETLSNWLESNFNEKLYKDEVKALIGDLDPSYFKMLTERVMIRSVYEDEHPDDIISDEIEKLINLNDNDEAAPQIDYLTYINNRQGSDGLIIDKFESIENLRDHLKKHEGTIYLPIISLKEKDAIISGLSQPKDWMDKAQFYVEEFAKILGYKYNEVKWIAAYHEKLETNFNKKKDAGKQPHIHFMIWVDGLTNSKTIKKRSWEKLKKNELQRARQKASSVFLDSYLSRLKINENRNKKGLRIVGNSFDEPKNQLMLWQTNLLIEKVTKNLGRRSYGSFLLTSSRLEVIHAKISYGIELDKTELSTLEKFGIRKSKDSVLKSILTYEKIFDNLHLLLDWILSDRDLEYIFNEWINAKRIMAESWSNKNETEILVQDYIFEMRIKLINQILQINDDWQEEVVLNEFACGRLLEAINEKAFKKNVKFEDTIEHVKVFSRLLVSMGYRRKEIIDKISRLYTRSTMVYSTLKIVDIMSEEYNNRTKEMIVDIDDYNNAMFAINTTYKRPIYPYMFGSRKSPFQEYRKDVSDILTKPIKVPEVKEKGYYEDKYQMELSRIDHEKDNERILAVSHKNKEKDLNRNDDLEFER